MKPAEVRITLILLAAVFGVSVSLLAGKAFLYKQPVPAAPPVSVVPETQTVPVAPSLTELPAASTAPAPSAAPAAPAASTAPASSTTPSSDGPVAVSLRTDSAPKAPAATAPASTKSAPIDPAPAKPAPSAEKPVATTKAPAAKIPPSAKTSASTTASGRTAASFAASRTSAVRPVRPKKGYLVFVFDDAGHNLEQLDPYLRLPFPCTIAVLPGLRYSGEAARRIRAAGKTVILHQPMQAINRSMDPGPGAITADMDADRIRAIVRANLAEVGPVVGINNHEGSLITADRIAMEAVFDVVREKGIYFLDSRTNANTAAPIVARERKMTIWERSVFLDNSQDKADIIEAISGGMKIAEKKGSAIMIGHIWSNDLANILTSMYPELVSQGFSLSTIAEIATERDFGE